MPCKQTLCQLTTGLCGNQWSEDLFCGKQTPFPSPISTFASSELTLPPFVEPSQHNEPPIPGLSQASDFQLASHGNNFTCEPEPEVTPTQSLEEPFACPATPLSFIIINNLPVKTPLPHLPSSPLPPIASENPSASSPRNQSPLIPMMRLCMN
ncbi:hypothetical protein O181_012253 [Austropuccinia psidii MF-1]|uniref:Uncharacterized protein n=1 Tax=Austropuccinia psidii MF-1 TaxID=1389203 RepID=A0A9Q3GM19_9BASI|nr:hypothetical protein [Austropuccinia psidii MF-1]